jgi:hypothetical protein
MRKWTILLILMVAACRPGPEQKMIAGGWKYDMEATLQALQASGADQQTINFTRSIMIGLQGATLELQSSGKATFAISDLSASGQWRLKHKGAEFHLRLDSIEQVSEILYLSADTLILNQRSEDNPGSLRVLTRP